MGGGGVVMVNYGAVGVKELGYWRCIVVAVVVVVAAVVVVVIVNG